MIAFNARTTGHPDVAKMTAAQAAAERDNCIEKARALNEERADPETGMLSDEDQQVFNTLVYRAEVCSQHREQALRDGFEKSVQRGSGSMERKMKAHDEVTSGDSRPGVAAFINTRTGEKVFALSHGDRLSEGNFAGFGSSSRLGVGETVRQLALGEGGSAEFAANVSGSDSAGGYLATPEFSRDVLDLARSASVVSRAGARTVELSSNELHLARLTQDATAVWRQEGEAIASSDLAFDRVTLRPRTVAALCTLSVELLEDAGNASQVVENSLTQALGLALDRAALFGNGAEAEPLGLFSTSGVNTVASVGTPDDYADVTSAVRQILTANYPGDPAALAWLGHPRDFATFDGLTDSTGQPLRPTPWASQLRPLSTTTFPIAAGDSSTSMVVGDFSQLVLGMRTSGVRIEVFRSGSVTDTASVTRNAVSEMLVHIRAYLRADVAVMRPAWFTKLTGVTAAS